MSKTLNSDFSGPKNHRTTQEMQPVRETEKVPIDFIDRASNNFKLALSSPKTVSYWAGLRFKGPISPHERKENELTIQQIQKAKDAMYSRRL